MLRAMLRPDNQTAWTIFLKRYRPMIARWCRERGLRHHETEAVLSLVLERLLRHLDGYDRKRGRFRAWLRTMVDRLVKDCLRARRRRPERPCGDFADAENWLEQLPDPCSLDDLVEDGCEQVHSDLLHDLMATFRRVRARTTRKVWKAFWRTTVKGEPTPQVATALGMRQDAVSKAKFRIRLKVLEEFQRLRGSHCS